VTTELPGHTRDTDARRARRLWRCGALAAVLALGIGLRLLAVYHTDPTGVSDRPLSDDSYYYFSLGRSLAGGHGARIDDLHPTTGFQPLWGFSVAWPYLLFPGELVRPLIAVQLMGVLIGAVTGCVIFALTLRLFASLPLALLSAGLWLVAPQTVRHDVSGMETGLAICLGFATLWAVARAYQHRSAGALAAAGLICGFAVLARVDNAILAAASLLALIVWKPGMTRVRAAALFGVGVALPLLPWLALTRWMGRPFMPESGPAVRALALILRQEQPANLDLGWHLYARDGIPELLGSKALMFLGALGQDVYLLTALPTGRAAVGAAGFLALSVAALAASRNTARPITFIWICSAAVTTLAYSTYVLADWFFFRYALPAAEIFCVLAPATVLAALARRSRRAAQLTALGLAVMALAGSVRELTRNADFIWILEGSQAVPDAGTYRVVEWAGRNLSPGQRLGAFQSGVIGYYAEATVYNLDGKVNPAVHRAILAGEVWQYLCREKIDYVADWPLLIDRFLVARSRDWNPGRLQLVETFTGNPPSPIHVYRIDQSQCPESSETEMSREPGAPRIGGYPRSRGDALAEPTPLSETR
jgi:hypothetical protein